MAALVPFHVICVRKALVMYGKNPLKLLVRPLYKLATFVAVLGKLVETVQPVT